MSANVAGGLTSIAAIPMEYALSNQQAEQAQKWNLENMAQSYQYQRALNRSSSSDAVEGMRAAGLNPALMNGPLSPSSAPSALPGPKAEKVAVAQNFAMLANAFADVDLKKAQTEEQNIINNRMRSEDDFSKTQVIDKMKQQLQLFRSANMDTSILEERIAQFEMEDFDFNSGHLEAFRKASEILSNDYSLLSQNLDQVAENVGVLHILNKDRSLFGRLKLQESLLQMAQLGLISSETDVNFEQINNLKKAQDHLDSEIALNEKKGNLSDAQANQIRNGDLHTMVENGEWGRLAKHEGLNISEKVAQGVGVGIGLKSLSGLGRFSKSGTLGKSLTSQVSKTSQGYKSRGSKFLPSKPSFDPFPLGSTNSTIFKNLIAKYGEQRAREIVKGFKSSGYQNFSYYLYKKGVR